MDQHGLVQKQRRRSPRHLPPPKPSPWHTFPQLLWLTHVPLNLWLADSHVRASTATGPIPVATNIMNKRRTAEIKRIEIFIFRERKKISKRERWLETNVVCRGTMELMRKMYIKGL
uniref:Uncharacterized protein n=1 Tax=Noccaea caerulescens TaxID=107243 RepID=A0A1J3JJG0_NOCCA